MNNNTNNFNYTNIPENMNFNKIKVGVKNLEDAILDLGSIRKSLPNYPYGDKRQILRAIAEKDVKMLRATSNFFYDSSGIYERVCNYFAFLYRYDWYIVPELKDGANQTKVLKDFGKL